jgi:hypothetical protein
MSEVDKTEWFLVLDRIIMVILALDIFANFLTGSTVICAYAQSTALLHACAPRHTVSAGV